MYKNTNLKIRPFYKTLALGSLLMLVGCRPERKNVIVDVKDIGNKRVFVLRDIKTDIERFYTVEYSPRKTHSRSHNMSYDIELRYLVVGDTVGVKKIRATNYCYARSDVLEHDNYTLLFNDDTVAARQRRGLINQNSVKQR